MQNSNQSSRSPSSVREKDRGQKRSVDRAELDRPHAKRLRGASNPAGRPTPPQRQLSFASSGSRGDPIDVDASEVPMPRTSDLNRRPRPKATTVSAYLGPDAEDRMLIISDSGEKPYTFRLYTKAQYVNLHGPADAAVYDNLRTLYRAPNESGSYLSRRQLYDVVERQEADSTLKRCGMAPGRFAPGITHSYSIKEYPSMIVRIDMGEGKGGPEFHGSLPQPGDNRSFDEMIDQFGRANIWLQTRGVFYKSVDDYDRSEPWSARGGVALATGWPKAIIRDDDGRFIDLRRYCNDRGSLNGSLKEAPHGGAFSPSLPEGATVLILKRNGDGYISPQLLKERDPEAFGALIDAAGLPRHVADQKERQSPNILIDIGGHVFVEPEHINEAIGESLYRALIQDCTQSGDYIPQPLSRDHLNQVMEQGRSEAETRGADATQSQKASGDRRDAAFGAASARGSRPDTPAEAVIAADDTGKKEEIISAVPHNEIGLVKSDGPLDITSGIKESNGKNTIVSEAEQFVRDGWTDLDVDRSDIHRWECAKRLKNVKSIAGHKILSVPPKKDLMPSQIYWKTETAKEYADHKARSAANQRGRQARERSVGRD